MLFFGKKKKKEQELDQVFDKVIEEINAVDSWDDPKKLEHYILDSCEQIIETTREIEAEKTEYRVVTAYLNDIQKIENLSSPQYVELRDVASNVVELNSAREAYQNSSKNITDEQFVLMEQDEETIPSSIHRMQENEIYQAKIKRDMNYLEAEKSQWEIEREDLMAQEKLLKKVSILLLVSFASLLALVIVLQTVAKIDLTWAMLIVFLFGGVSGFIVFLKESNGARDSKRALVKMNQAIAMLNRIRMKYVNVTNAVEYTKDKYKVNNSYELNYLWEQYVDAVKEKERYLKNNDDFEYFTGRLMRLLQKIDLYDHKIWLTQTEALVNQKEMVEVKHTLVERRQKIRQRIEQNTQNVQSERNEIDRLMTEHDHYVPEIHEIIKSVDKLCGIKQ